MDSEEKANSRLCCVNTEIKLGHRKSPDGEWVKTATCSENTNCSAKKFLILHKPDGKSGPLAENAVDDK
jgi:hypothetical protein